MNTAYLSDKDLARRFSVSRTSIWRWCRDTASGFPKPVQLGPAVTRWRVADIEAWEAQKARASGATSASEAPA